MLGTRGVRLGVLKPGLYAMQVRALMEAALDRVAAGGTPVIEIMIPLTIGRQEMALARSWVEEAVAAASAPAVRSAKGAKTATGGRRGRQGRGSHRHHDRDTARRAARPTVAEEAEFFSFGTNDLTQMTLGFSRDDVEGRMMAAYLEKGLLPHNPFETIDADGVGELVRMGVVRGRSTRPSLKIGVCGEHGGTRPRSRSSTAAGLDYVSCSPFRVPIARLSAAQAILALADRPVPRASHVPPARRRLPRR